MLSKQSGATVRGEYFNDKNGFHFAATAGRLERKYYEGTLCTLAYLPNSSVELRTEVRVRQGRATPCIDQTRRLDLQVADDLRPAGPVQVLTRTI